MRTINDLRNSYLGKLYVIFGNEDIARQFLKDAQEEGYRFGEIKPEDNHASDMIAIEKDHKLAYVGTIGRTAVQAGAATLIDYAKYVSGQSDYVIKQEHAYEHK